jgi:rare lipoprotein A
MTLRLSARAALACFALAGSAACAPASADWIGQASFYGYESGKVRADGRPFRPMQPGAAHWTLPLGTRVRVTDLPTKRHVDVTVKDRGPHP